MANVHKAMEYAAQLEREAIAKRDSGIYAAFNKAYEEKEMSDLRARAREIASRVAAEVQSDGGYNQDALENAIESALLRFGAECLRLEATWQMEYIGVEVAGEGYRDCDNLSSDEASNVFRAMAEEGAKCLGMK